MGKTRPRGRETAPEPQEPQAPIQPADVPAPEPTMAEIARGAREAAAQAVPEPEQAQAEVAPAEPQAQDEVTLPVTFATTSARQKLPLLIDENDAIPGPDGGLVERPPSEGGKGRCVGDEVWDVKKHALVPTGHGEYITATPTLTGGGVMIAMTMREYKSILTSPPYKLGAIKDAHEELRQKIRILEAQQRGLGAILSGEAPAPLPPPNPENPLVVRGGATTQSDRHASNAALGVPIVPQNTPESATAEVLEAMNPGSTVPDTERAMQPATGIPGAGG